MKCCEIPSPNDIYKYHGHLGEIFTPRGGNKREPGTEEEIIRSKQALKKKSYDRSRPSRMAGAHFVRKGLRLTTDEGAYEGLCSCVDPISRRITLVQGIMRLTHLLTGELVV